MANPGSTQPADIDTSVLIVGAGPAGLAFSLTLRRYGVDHLLVERHPGTAHTPRAHIVNQRTVEIFRHLGLEERLLAVATPNDDVQQHLGHHPGRPRGRPAADLGHRPGPRRRLPRGQPQPMANCPQTVLEPVLLEAAREAGADLRFGHEFLHSTQDQDGVTTMVRDRATGTT